MPILGELIYTPFITLVIIIVAILAISIVMGKRSETGLIPSASSNVEDVSLIQYVSNVNYGSTITVDSTLSNRILYVSGDKANLTSGININIFDPTLVEPGTTLTIFNSPTSSWPTKMTVLWVGSSSSNDINGASLTAVLGTGMGVTLITQQRIGPHIFVDLGGVTINPPDLTPSLLQPRDWVIFEYLSPQSSMCSAINSSAYSSVVDSNILSPCGLLNVSNTPTGLRGSGSALACTSLICQCLPNPLNVWPPPFSQWCDS